jgi:GT2 family glycosyltransferase
MQDSLFFSIVIPVYNRPDEVNECLQSLCKQSLKDFEVILADGSPTDILKSVISNQSSVISQKITHIHVPNLGISESRNLGCEKAEGNFFIFLDSDCIIPPDYLLKASEGILKQHLDAFGGPDAAESSFTSVQKAINYTMTSYFTTGGIRGKKNQFGPYHPRSFNMGISKEVFVRTGGFSSIKVSEDIDLSIRIIKEGFKVGLIQEAYVYHKRRTNFVKFFSQVYRFGAGRINMSVLHKGELKLIHVAPAAFQMFLLLWVISVFINTYLFLFFSGFLAIYFLSIFIDSSVKNKSIYIGLLSILAAVIQFNGYGSGFIRNFFEVYILRKKKGII